MNTAKIRFPIVEIFHSLQGEGANVGMEAVFLRLGKCNLNCPWCDTEFNKYNYKELGEILEEVKKYNCPNIIITGGEATIYKNLNLLSLALKKENYKLFLESNGLINNFANFDYIALSPKYIYKDKYQNIIYNNINEIRIVVDNYTAEFLDFCLLIRKNIRADYYFLSPCELKGEINLLETIKLLGKLNQNLKNNKWLLSLQTHKIIGIE